jgi:hypothetical protein
VKVLVKPLRVADITVTVARGWSSVVNCVFWIATKEPTAVLSSVRVVVLAVSSLAAIGAGASQSSFRGLAVMAMAEARA